MSLLPEWVDACVVFGSAVTERCRADSDVDAALIGCTPNGDWLLTPAKQAADAELDVLTYPSFERLYDSADNNPWFVERQIVEKGVVIYVKPEFLGVCASRFKIGRVPALRTG